MTALDITYEDGLRLSELQGQLAGLKFESSHLIEINVVSFLLVIVLGVAISILPMCYLWSIDHPSHTRFGTEEEARVAGTWAYKPKIVKPIGKDTVTKLNRVTNKLCDVSTPMEVRWVHTWTYHLAAILPFIAISLALSIIMLVYLEASIEMAIADTQAQIDAILAKYEVGA